MRRTIALSAVLLAGVIAGRSQTARAQEHNYLERPLPAPTDALELKVGTGYTQGFGTIAPGRSVRDVAGPGLGIAADVDYRLSPAVSLGLQGQYQQFSSALNTGARGIATNIGMTYHAMPLSRGDPFARVATGYRLLWEQNPVGAAGLNVVRHGFELASATLGYDVRVSDDISLAPTIGADLNLLVWQDINGVNRALSSPQVASFVYAGIEGRFDLGGDRAAAQPRVVSQF